MTCSSNRCVDDKMTLLRILSSSVWYRAVYCIPMRTQPQVHLVMCVHMIIWELSWLIEMMTFVLKDHTFTVHTHTDTQTHTATGVMVKILIIFMGYTLIKGHTNVFLMQYQFETDCITHKRSRTQQVSLCKCSFYRGEQQQERRVKKCVLSHKTASVTAR